jgi:molybdopterin-guanine dinucleotide biosynthesis protein B
MKNIAVAFTGPSNSGKTTLIVKVATKLKEDGYKVCIIKNDPKDKARFDTVGKDSYKFSQTGADVAVVSPKKTTIFKQSSSTLDEMKNIFNEFDYLLVEGLKTLPLPRIAIFRNQLNEDYYEVSDAIATDGTITSDLIPTGCQHLDLNNIDQIIQWINNQKS